MRKKKYYSLDEIKKLVLENKGDDYEYQLRNELALLLDECDGSTMEKITYAMGILETILYFSKDGIYDLFSNDKRQAYLDAAYMYSVIIPDLIKSVDTCDENTMIQLYSYSAWRGQYSKSDPYSGPIKSLEPKLN